MKLTARFALSAEYCRKLSRDLCPSQHGRVCAAVGHLPLGGAAPSTHCALPRTH